MDNGSVQQYLELAEEIFSGDLVVAFPSMGEYPIYDDLAYQVMCGDSTRMAAYRKAIGKVVPGKTVVDIGTGQSAPLAVMCAEAGARKVYAVESDEATARKAEGHLAVLGLSGRVQVIHGNSTEIELPEKVDVCVSEIIGNIGGAEGAPAVLENAARFLKPGGVFIPDRCMTKLAPATLPERPYSDEMINGLIDYYTNKVYENTGERFPFTRYVYYNFPKENLIAAPMTFENDHFNLSVYPDITKPVRFHAQRDGRLDGFLLWIELHVDSENVIDSLHESDWGPVFLKTEGIDLKRDDTVNAVCERRISRNRINPDYFIYGSVSTGQQISRSFSIDSYHTLP